MPDLITLIPDSGLQFWDAPLTEGALPRITRAFWDAPLGDGRVALRALRPDPHQPGLLVDADGEPAPDEDYYQVDSRMALAMHLGRWVPLPYLLVRARDQSGREVYARGPTNWARARLAEREADTPDAPRELVLTLAFDTALLPEVDGAPYVAPSPQNSERQGEFAFAAADSSWFQDEPWVTEWLREMLVELRLVQSKGRPLNEAELALGCRPYAHYQVFLAMLQEAGVMPRVRLLDGARAGQAPVYVDLALDIGNARTCGILIEEHPSQGLNLADSYPLALRDLSRPEWLHERPFDSRVEFCRASFGRDALSKRSGRASAFAWPSPVRVGPEAVRLAGARQGNEGATGLSSPKRYLWDTRPFVQGWRFNGRATDGVTTDPPVGGPFMALVTEDGGLLRDRKTARPALLPRFSRSSLFAFMLAELVLQAVCQVNAPGNRARRRDAERPRQLRGLMITMPPGMPVAEQALLGRRAREAVRLAWQMLGWTAAPGMPEPPKVVARLDEATATQIVWLHNEVTERLQGDAGALMQVVGRVRPELAPEQAKTDPALAGAPSLRVASIDIGGGTTDLMVTTYLPGGGEAIVPRQEFRESVKIAGDDVLERVVSEVVVPALRDALRDAGVPAPGAVLSRALGQDQGGQAEQDRHLRRLFVSAVLEPAAIAVLAAYERVEGRATGEVLRAGLGALAGPATESTRRAMRWLQEHAERAGGRAVRLEAAEVAADTGRIEAAIRSVLGPVLADLCEVVWAYDCDVLLLSGRPSRLRAVGDMVLAKAPVAPHRIVGMHRYRVGEKYPFRDAANRIDDPKTTAAVGAALCVQAEAGRLRNFMLRTAGLRMRSTARFIGRMDQGGQIRDRNVLLPEVDLDGPPQDELEFKLSFQAATQIGFRQLPLERWTATPLYMMEFANPDTAARMALPLRVTVARRTSGDAEDEAGRELFAVTEVEDAHGSRLLDRDVVLRLQTMEDGDGYWRDTGRLQVHDHG